MADADLPVPTEQLVRRLYELACTPFTPAAWMARWDQYRWSYDPWPADELPFSVTLPEGFRMRVQSEDDGLVGASLPIYFWEEYDPEFHDDPREHARQKKRFDDRFDATAEVALRHLPEPFFRWTDADQSAHRAMVWEGTSGILVLQQASVDPQFGIEVDFWVDNCRKEEFRPQTPLIDWLMNRGTGR
jgi:hypothetical protein